MERTSASTLGSKPKDYRIKLQHEPTEIELEVARLKEIKAEHDSIREHRENLNKLLRGQPPDLPRQVYKNLLVVERPGYRQPPAVIDMADYAPDDRLLLFHTPHNYYRGTEPPYMGYGWRFNLNDALVLPSTSQLGRAVLWQMCLRAESRAKNNLMVQVTEVGGLVAGNTEFYRDRQRHLMTHATQVNIFGETDCKPYDSWVVHIHRVCRRTPTGATLSNSGVLIVCNPEAVNLDKCEADYTMAMLAGVKSTDLQRRIGDDGDG